MNSNTKAEIERIKFAIMIEKQRSSHAAISCA